MTGALPRIERSELGTLTQLSDDGGQAIVYRFSKGSFVIGGKEVRLVFKEYRTNLNEPVNRDALERLMQVRSSLDGPRRAQLVSCTAFPVHIVTDRGSVVGFTMTKVPNRFYQKMTFASAAEQRLAEIQYLLNSDTYLLNRGITVSDVQRSSILRGLVSTLDLLHANDVAVGDLSAKNMLFSLEASAPYCFILDADGMRVGGQPAALKQVESPGWEVANVSREELGTKKTDIYKLGLLALRIFARDQFSQDSSSLSNIDPDLAKLALRSVQHEPGKRPKLSDWVLATADLEKRAKSARPRTTGSRPRLQTPITTTGQTASSKIAAKRLVTPPAAKSSPFVPLTPPLTAAAPPTRPSAPAGRTGTFSTGASASIGRPTASPSTTSISGGGTTSSGPTKKKPRRYVRNIIVAAAALGTCLLGLKACSSLLAAPLSPTGVTASCTSAASKDGSGKFFSYNASNVSDDDPETAWRCDGDGSGQSITLTFSGTETVKQISIIPGYAKVDPVDRTDRYVQNRRITSVTYVFDTGASVTQTLDSSPSRRDDQSVTFTPRATRKVVVKINSSIAGQSTNGEDARNKVAISELKVFAE